MSRRKFLGLSAAAAAGVMLVGCSGGGSDAASTEGGDESNSASADMKTVSIAAQPNSGQVFVYIAKDQGYLAEEGIDIKMEYINNGTDAFQAMDAGKVDIMSTYGTGGPLIQIAAGKEYTIFGGYMITGETPCFGKPETEWKDLESFRGKKIGITRFGTPDIVLKGVLYDAGLYNGPDDAEVEFVEFKTNQETLQAVANGEIDFGATATGYELQAEALGLEIKMWPDDYWHDHSCCRMECLTSFLEDEGNQESLYRMFRAFIRAEEYLQDNKDRVVELVVNELDLDQPTVESFVYSEHMKYNTDPNKKAVETMWDKMKAFGYIDNEDINIDDHINVDIYGKALQSLVDDYPDDAFFQQKLEEFNKNDA
ncbi:MAG: ABC transporter substrate-binding protein [Eggerthellaceae bacterium]|nr:ABC transporter substrate-binding protein [Eggerthellaceae bacterium]